MSIEAMKQAIDALNEAVAFREGGRQKAIDAITALRTAIQQAEAKTDEPVYQIRKAFSQDAEWVWRDATEELFHMHPKENRRILYTHPAPGVPSAVDPPVEDGTEYDYCSGRAAGYAEGWNACRDEMLTSAQAKKGQQ